MSSVCTRSLTLRRILSGALVPVLLVALAACSTSSANGGSDDRSSAPSGPHNGGKLVYALAEDASGWNPISDVWSRPAMQIARALFDPLMVYDENNQLQPELAESVTPNDDFTEWTITLRPGVLFQDGTAVDAAVVRRNLEGQRTSALAGPWLVPIKSIYVTGPLTLNVLMRSAWSTFPDLLTAQPGFIAAPAMLDDPQGASHPIGSGPFTFRAWTPGTALTATKNSTYRIPGLPRLDELDFRIEPDPTERTDALLAGRVDVIGTADPTEIARLTAEAQKGTIQFATDVEGESPKVAVALNTARMPFLDAGARQAVTLATDRRQISEQAFDGVDPLIKGPVSPTSPWFVDVVVPDREVARARQLAADYRVTYGVPLTFEMLVPPKPPLLRAAAIWQRQLAEAGIEMVMVPTYEDQLRADAAAGNFDAAMDLDFDAWSPDRSYASLHEAQITPVGVPGPNVTRFGTDGIDHALDRARATDDLAKQVEEYRNVQNELVGGSAYVFMVRMIEGVAARNDVRDLLTWTTSAGPPGLPLDGPTVSLAQVWLDRPERPAE